MKRHAVGLAATLLVLVTVGCESWQQQPPFVATDPVVSDSRRTHWRVSGAGEAPVQAPEPADAAR
jgi:hypothetical protein